MLVKERYGLTYRDAEIYLKENMQTCLECGMTEMPDHNTIWRTITKLREPYLKQLNHEVNRLFKNGETHSRRRHRLQPQGILFMAEKRV